MGCIDISISRPDSSSQECFLDNLPVTNRKVQCSVQCFLEADNLGQHQRTVQVSVHSWPQDWPWSPDPLLPLFSVRLSSLKVKSESEVTQSCPTLCDPMDCSLPGSSLHGILQARVLEWGAISFSRGSSRPRDRTRVSRTPGRRFNLWATRALALVKHPCYYGRFLCGSEGLPFTTFRQLFLLLFTKTKTAFNILHSWWPLSHSLVPCLESDSTVIVWR